MVAYCQYTDYQCNATMGPYPPWKTLDFMPKRPAHPVSIDQQPGYAIRRLHQISVSLFLQETQAHGVTPVQYAALQTLGNHPGIDQRTLARAIAQDTSTTAGVVDRLETRGLLIRQHDPRDKRVRLLTLTPDGNALLNELVPAMLRAQTQILAPLTPEQRQVFMSLLDTLVQTNNDHSRAPRTAP